MSAFLQSGRSETLKSTKSKVRFRPKAAIELDQVATSQAGIRDLYGDEVLRILDLSVAFNSNSLFYAINL